MIDIICHGVPSPQYWQDYLKIVKGKIGEFKTINFRDKKSYGWNTKYGTFTLLNGVKKKMPYPFYMDILFRESCNKCPHTNLQRPSDITIGDYWGLDRTKINFSSDNKGCSLVICNTLKGRKLFQEIKSGVYYKEVTINECIQPNLTSPSAKHPKHSTFINCYKEKGFEYAMYKTYCWGWKATVKKKIRKFVNILRMKKEFR